MNKFYITTPIYYVNDRPHAGHAYTTVVADVLARWHRTRGDQTFFQTGTDEHGAKVAEAARKAVKSEQEFVDEKAAAFRKAWQKLNINYDNFLRTTDPAHVAAVAAAVQYLYEKGFIYKGQYQGLYCQSCEQYKTPDDLIDGKCPEHQIELQPMREESYFFKLSQFEKVLREKIESGEFGIEPIERKNEILTFFKKGLKDISISRANVVWGIPLPFDKNYSLYVWVDAFLNYLTGLGWKGEAGKAPKFFPPEVQLMSKDILRVHATIWPGLLLALEFPLPKKIYVHGYFTIDGQKMSKSIGNVIWPEELVDKFGVDGARYLLISSLAYGQDGDISWERLREKYNADLANGLGNLVSRVIKLSQVYSLVGSHEMGRAEKQNSRLTPLARTISELYDEFKLKEILDLIWRQIAWANKYIEEKRLWELVKDSPDQGKKVLAELLSLISELADFLVPFMPQTSEKIKKILVSGQIKEILFPRI